MDKFSKLYSLSTNKGPYLAQIFLVLFIISALVLNHNTPHYPYGDGPEYVIMTESFYNHLSPELRSEDGESYLKYLQSHDLEVFRKDEYQRAASDLNKTLNPTGYMKAKNGQWYCYHFWLYSLVNVPARALLEVFDADIRAGFLWTNLFILFLGLFLLFKMKNYALKHKIFLGLMLVLSPVFWYLDWIHPEVFTGVLVYVSLLYFFNNSLYLSLLLISLASTQNPPLAIPAASLFIYILYKKGLGWSNLIPLFFSSFWVITPHLFYYYHYGVISLIKESGILHPELVSLRRLFDFVFDLNQGMIIGIPGPLLLVLVLLIIDLFRRKWKPEYLMLLYIAAMSLLFMQLGNWNSGNAFVKRYVVYTAPFVIIVFYLRLKDWKPMAFNIGMGLILLIQAATIFGQAKFNKVFWSSNELNNLSKYVLSNYPSLYNPDPQVFERRTSPFELSRTDSVYIYTNEENKIVKMMVKEGSISQLVLRGADPKKVKELDQNLNYYLGFAYLNPSDLNQIDYRQENDTLIAFIEKGKADLIKSEIRENLYNTGEWFDKVVQQAKDLEISLDSCVQLNVNYQYNIEMEKRKK